MVGLPWILGFVASAVISSRSGDTQVTQPRPARNIITRYETLIVSAKNLTVGCTLQRESVVINGTFPGPVLRFNSYERIIINVTNQLSDQNFTMHWHGLAMAGSPWSDGTPMISQWPIASGDYFLYEFFPTSENVGTYFYHSHVGMQLSTAHGALIISDSDAPTNTSPEPIEKVMVLADNWFKEDRPLTQGLLADPFVWTGSSNEIYLNGLSNGTMKGEQCSASFPVIDVLPSMTYRLRWIHAGVLMYLSAGIQSHKLEIIEADGTELEPLSVDHIELGNAQRYSTLLHTKTRAEIDADGQNGLYLIKFSSRWRSPGVENYAILRYPSPNPSRTCSEGYVNMSHNKFIEKTAASYILPKETIGWLASSLKPRVMIPIPSNENKTTLALHVQQKQWGAMGLEWTVNDNSYWEFNATRNRPPFLVQFYQNLSDTTRAYAVEKSPSQDVYEAFSDTYVLEAGQVIDIVLINEPGPNNKTEIHPWHLHGRKFWILASGEGNFNETSLAAGLFPRPIMRDTVNVYPGYGNPSCFLRIAEH